MKMAKASEADLDMAMELSNAFGSLTQRWGAYVPEKAQADPDSEAIERLDLDDHEQCRRVLGYLLDVAGRASLMRVVFGMAVVCDSTNELLDPEADTLEHHPKHQAFRDEVRDLLYGPHPTCCGNMCEGASYMGSSEEVCCGQPDMDTLGDAEIVKCLRALVPAPAEAAEVRQ